MSDVFSRFAPFIQDYIYRCKWEELREIQVLAAKAIFDTDENLLLSSGTASGKTEAAFLPVLTQLWGEPLRERWRAVPLPAESADKRPVRAPGGASRGSRDTRHQVARRRLCGG